MKTHQATACDRTYVRLMQLGGQVHCIEVQRRDGLYSGRIFVALDQLLLQTRSAESKAHGEMVAISHGVGFESIKDVFRSLRKDVQINQMAIALSAAAFAQSASRSLIPRTDLDVDGLSFLDA